MAHPQDYTMADLELLNSSAVLVFVNAETDPLGQLQDFTLRGNIPNEKISRIGDTSKKTVFKPGEFSVDMKMFSDTVFLELAQVVTGSNPGTWNGTDTIELTPTSDAFDLSIKVFDGASGSVIDDNLKATITVVNFKPATMELPVSGDANAIWTLNGQCDRWYITPEATA